MPRLKTVFPLLLSLLCLGSIQAQSNNSFDTERGFRLVGISVYFDDLAYEHNGEVIPLSASSSRLSRLYPLPRNETLEIFRELPIPANAPPGTPAPRRPIASIKLLPSVNSQLVLLAPSPSGETLSGLAIDAMAETHNLGQARLINASARRVAFSFGGDPHRSGPRTTDLVVPIPTGIATTVVAIEGDESNTWTPVVDRRERFLERSRMFIILIDRQPTAENPVPVSPMVFFEYSRPTPPPNA